MTGERSRGGGRTTTHIRISHHTREFLEQLRQRDPRALTLSQVIDELAVRALEPAADPAVNREPLSAPETGPDA